MPHDLVTERVELVDEVEVAEVTFTGDYSGQELSFAQIERCRIDHARFTAGHLIRSHLLDCLFVGSDLSGCVLEECQLTRVEFRGCRLSGIQAQGSRFVDVGFVDCKIEGANFRMTTWERAEFDGSVLADADFYAASLPGTRLHGCDLGSVELSKSDLTGSRLHGSLLDGIRGADRLRGVTIGGDQIVPVALALFGALDIVVSDEEP